MSLIELWNQHFPECEGVAPQRIQNFLKEMIDNMFISRDNNKPVPVNRLFDITFPFNFKVSDTLDRRTAIKSILKEKYGNYPVLERGSLNTIPSQIAKDLVLTSNSPILSDLFLLYDHYFTGHTFLGYSNGSIINLEFSDLLTSTSGKCGFRGNRTYVLRISTKILNNISDPGRESVIRRMLADNQADSRLQAGGITISDRLDGLMLIFEHELIHLMIFIAEVTDTGSHGQLFKQMVINLFGQTSMTHGLIAKPNNGLSKDAVKIGDIVYFTHRKEEVLGIVQKVNKKTVQVHTDQGEFRVDYSGIRSTPNLK